MPMNHKHTLLLAGALSLSVLFAACGTPQGEASEPPAVSAQASQPAAPSEPPESTAPASEEPPESTAPASEEPSESQPTDTEAMKELALTFVDKSVEELIDALGEPTGTDYAPSCLGDGEDGELFYDGFSVYTYREGTTETVTDVF